MNVHRILLYPIKSLDGLSVKEAEVTSLGTLKHDREWALVDAKGNFINGKREPRIHQIRTAFDSAVTEVELRTEGNATPSFFPLEDVTALARWFSDYLEQPVQLLRDQTHGFPDDLDANGPTVVSELSLIEVAGWFGLELDEVRRRFRTNLELGGGAAFWEDRLCRKAGEPVPFQIGAVVMHGMTPCQRCAVPAREPNTGRSTQGFQKEFSRKREENLPSWAEKSRFDHFYRFALNTRIPAGQTGSRIRVGDAITLPNLSP